MSVTQSNGLNSKFISVLIRKILRFKHKIPDFYASFWHQTPTITLRFY